MTKLGIIFSKKATLFILFVAIKAFVTNESTSTLNFNKRKKILIWTAFNRLSRGIQWPHGDHFFKENNCEYQNCFIAGRDNESLKIEVDKYDAILFNSVDLFTMDYDNFPTKRSPNQRYVFTSAESADRIPLCKGYYDGMFNWTMTYKLDSDFPVPYFIVNELKNGRIGPAINVLWTQHTLPINDTLKLELGNKTKLAAWFVSHCNTRNMRKEFVVHLQKELKRFNIKNNKIDIYGSCGPLKCPKTETSKCNKMIKKDYVFYMAMENSFAKDYVTEKVLIGLYHNAIPIVYGGADYARFLPNGSYINALLLGHKKLAQTMYDVIQNSSVLHKYFQWRNHYSFQRNKELGMCQLCAALNKNLPVQRYQNFRRWWNVKYRARCERFKKKNWFPLS